MIWRNRLDENYIHVIRSGILIYFDYVEYGKESIYTILGKGHCLGILDLYLKNKLQYILQSLTDVECCLIHVDTFKQFIVENPEFQKYHSIAAYNLMISGAEYIEVISQKRVHERIKQLLLLLVRLKGNITEEVKLSLTHEDLARLVCSDRVTVTRTLHLLEEEKVIRLANRNITVIVPAFQADISSSRFIVPETELQHEEFQKNARSNQRITRTLLPNLPHV